MSETGHGAPPGTWPRAASAGSEVVDALTAAEAEVCVIGAGIMGASTAFHLAERGADVLVLDRGAPGAEASGATAGTLAVQNKHLAVIPLVLRCLDMWKTLTERIDVDIEYERRGGFRVAHGDADGARLEEGFRAQRALGVESEWVEGERLRREAPYLSPNVSAATYCALDGMANPLAATRGFLRAARRHGARVWQGRAVTAVEVMGHRDLIVRLEQGSVRAATVVLAAGAWNAELARPAGVKLPLRTEILQASITDFGPALFPHILTHVRGNLTLKQLKPSGKILVGGAWPGDGSRESGVKRVRRESLVGNLKWATETIPAISGYRLLRAWVGFEGRTPDKLLMMGEAGPRGLFVVGCAGGGFTLAPIAGRLTAEAIRGDLTAIPPEFNVQRFLSPPAGEIPRRQSS